jgi:hypothetical protein
MAGSQSGIATIGGVAMHIQRRSSGEVYGMHPGIGQILRIISGKANKSRCFLLPIPIPRIPLDARN